MNENIDLYLSYKKRLIPLNGKVPFVSDWVNSNFNKNELLKFKTKNLGWALDEIDLIIDVDVRNGGLESFKSLQTDLGKRITPTVKTPSGGFHCYFNKPAELVISKKIHQYPGIDFLSKGAQCVIAGSVINDIPYTWCDNTTSFIQQDATNDLLNLLVYSSKAVGSIVDEDFGDLTHLNFSAFTKEKIIDLLYKIDSNCSYEKWIKIGMALHSWDAKDGLLLWEEWSKPAKNYEENKTQVHWRSFAKNKSLSLGTLVYHSRQSEIEQKSLELKNIRESIKSIVTREDLDKYINTISLDYTSSIDKEIIIKDIQNKYKEITQVKIPIRDIRKKLLPKYDNMSTSQWWDNWIYVNSHNSFMQISNYKLHKSESFNIINGKNIPLNESNNKQSAFKFVSDNGLIKVVEGLTYLPNESPNIIELEGKKMFNIFDPYSLPQKAKYYTKEGQRAIDVINNHIKLICNDNPQNISILTQWLAHQVQFVGTKILWSPIIQSIQGVGKSFFGEFLRCCLGDSNVGTINPTQVTSQFNSWSSGVAVNVLEELRIVGHNRYDVINALKPLITDRIIQINDKGVKQYVTYNTTNYICFTNYKDAIPIETDDRRWWVLFVNINSLNEIEKYSNKPLNEYFTNLFDSLKYHREEIIKWISEYPISKEFLDIKQSPNTDYKKSMITTEMNSIVGLSEVKEQIEKGGDYYNSECIISSKLFQDVIDNNSELWGIFNNHHKNKILKKLGYMLFDGKIKIGDKSYQIWTKRTLDREQILNNLNIQRL